MPANTEEPILNNTMNKGHHTFSLSSYIAQILWSLQYYGNTISPLKEQNLSIAVKLYQKLLVPKCPLFSDSAVLKLAVGCKSAKP